MVSLSRKASAITDALLNWDANKLTMHLSQDAVLHQDAEPDASFVCGSDSIQEALAKKWGRYSVADHQLLAAAADDSKRIAFALCWHKDVKPQDVQGDAPAWAASARDVVAVWHAVWNDEGKVDELFVLNTLPADVAFRQLAVAGDEALQKPGAEKHGALDFDPVLFLRKSANERNEAGAASDDLSKALAAGAAMCRMYGDNDPSAAKSILADDYREFEPIAGRGMEGAASVEEQLNFRGMMWQGVADGSHIAAADSGSVFVHWVGVGHMQPVQPGSGPMTFYGFMFLLTTPDGKAQKSVHLAVPRPKQESLRWFTKSVAKEDADKA